MGNYNPHAPYIIGQEWVPMRQANYQPDAVSERGYEFTIDHSAAAVSGAYYAAQPGSFQAGHLIQVYPVDTEDLTGPIKVIDIPTRSITTTGAGGVVGDDGLITFSGGTSPEYGVNFAVTNYIQQLAGKRILDIELLFTVNGSPAALERLDIELSRVLTIANSQGYDAGLVVNSASSALPDRYSLHIGDLNPFWASNITSPTYTFGLMRLYPWRYDELAWMDTVTIPALRLLWRFQCSLIGMPDDFMFISNISMRVTYCEEKRILYGADRLMNESGTRYTIDGGKYVQLRVPSTMALPTSINAGRYLVTERWQPFPPNQATPFFAPYNYAIRELYGLPPQEGRLVRQSYVADETFTSEETDVLPIITLHTASSIVTGVHAYGLQQEVPVYGSVTAVQEIEDDPVGTSKVYPQVRFYARRFGDTSVALQLADVGTGTFTVSISVADFDALPEIVDGWKEVTLRFANPPSFATAADDVDWRWSATGEISANQWQILGAGNVIWPSGASTGIVAQSTQNANYYAPYGTVNLTWMSPAITGTSFDFLSDATLLFSQDPNPVSGFALEIEDQSVATALQCDVLPNCIPSAIQYVNITWSRQSLLPVTGFGAYELERYDSVDGDWNQIMVTSSPFVTGFTDFESRVGQTSWYRIRSVNVLDFAGPWVTGSATLPSPGVTIAGDANSLLIFTTNHNTGASLAYIMQWENTPVEAFVFGEADMVQFNRMYQRNFPVAFHPLERDGEQFKRLILVNAAAIPLPSLGNFTQLRDLAWADVPCICVRDELGNRWYANVRVPQGEVYQDRTIYIAQIEVTEVSEIPCPVES